MHPSNLHAGWLDLLAWTVGGAAHTAGCLSPTVTACHTARAVRQQHLEGLYTARQSPQNDLFECLGDQGGRSGRLVLEGCRQPLGGLVVASQAVDARLDQNQPAWGS
eukprot:357397-Chlamydomonas_euryale.AAC.2